MASSTASGWQQRLRRPRLVDLVIAGLIVLLATAVAVNGVQTVHDTKRARLDKKVAARWFRAHTELGRFGPPRVKVLGHEDLACAAREVSGGKGNPIDGYCIRIADRNTHSTAILASYRCFYPRAAALGRPAGPRCLARH